MSFITLLAHRATIEELGGGEDRFGQPEDSWQLKDDQLDIPCRLKAATGREITTLQTRDGLEVTHVVYLGPLAVLTEANRVVDVKDSDNNVIADGLDVVLVKRISQGAGAVHHIEVWCKMVRDGS